MMIWLTVGGGALIVGLIATMMLLRARQSASPQGSTTASALLPKSRDTVARTPATRDWLAAVQSPKHYAATYAAVDAAPLEAEEQTRPGVEDATAAAEVKKELSDSNLTND